MLHANHLEISYKCSGDNKKAFGPISFTADVGGHITALIGKSGVGKSTFISLVADLLDMTRCTQKGELIIDEKIGVSPGPRGISWVPQSSALLDHLNVLDNVLLPLRLTEKNVSDTDNEFAKSLLARIGLLCSSHGKKPRALSGGEKARVSFVRALVARPQFLLLDEPFNGIDPHTRWQMYRMLYCERTHDKKQVTLIATHNIPEALILARKIVIIRSSDNNEAICQETLVEDYSPVLSNDKLNDLQVMNEARKEASQKECAWCIDV